MNILFVLYGDLGSNSAYPLALFARELHLSGHSCVVAVPNNLETISQHQNPSFRPFLYSDVLAEPERVFPDGRPADIIHAWTPRENVRRFVTSYMAIHPTPLLIYLEDNESWISCRALGCEEETLIRQTEQSISDRLPDALSHPFRYGCFIGLADMAVVIQDKLKIEVPYWVHCETVMPSVDLEFFSPRVANPKLRKQYGIAENERVIVYPGGLNGFTRPLIETLCKAVLLINRQGYPCRLLRTGPFAIDFMDQLPLEAVAVINDLGVLPRNELPDLLALADVFVQPGKIDSFEDLRLPGKLPELLAMGRAVVMPDVNIAHLFKDGVNAVLTRTGSAEEIATKCIELFSDPQRASEIGQAGRRFAEKYFDARSQTVCLENAYEAACQNFNPEIAAEVWQSNDENTPVAFLLARKLKMLVNLNSIESRFQTGEAVMEHVRYIELMERRVKGLEESIAERDGQIVNLNQSMSERDGQIVNLNQSMAERDGQIVKLNQSVAELDGQIKHLNQAVVERDGQITAIKSSTSWRITMPLRMLRRVPGMLALLPVAANLAGGYGALLLKICNAVKQEGLYGIKRRILYIISPLKPQQHDKVKDDYSEWVRRYDTITDDIRCSIIKRMDALDSKPRVSVVMPTYNPNPEWLIEAIESVRKQIYPNWELCIADDASTDEHIRHILEDYVRKDNRIKVIFRENNGHICVSSNSALSLATGEWVAFLDHDDVLTEHALFWVVDAINRNSEAQLIYSDEDKIDAQGHRCDPYFKSEWNPYLFRSHNMITHLAVYKKVLIDRVGGLREGFEGAQDYDLVFRCTEQLHANQIVHVPRVLYHWRIHQSSTAQSSEAKPYAYIAGEKAINEHLARTGIIGYAELLDFGMYRVHYALPKHEPLVSLIIPTRNSHQLVRQCIESILNNTRYGNYEILLVDNGSDEPESLRYFDELGRHPAIRVIRDARPFNYSMLNNAAVKQARGALIGLINNDIEVITPEWLGEMVSLAMQPGVGVVGARLWYPDNCLQHGGVILGLGGLAGHSHKCLPKGELGYVARASVIQGLSAVTAACLVVRKEIFDQVGGLEEKLKVAYNDVDFCIKVREAGYQNVWTPYAELYHHESATRGYEDTPEKKLRFSKETAFMKQRWGELLMNDPAYSPNLTLDREDFSLAWPPRVDIL